jgi:hypothetical protein
MIPDAMWQEYGGRMVQLSKGETLFDQGSTASHFFQVRTGKLKMELQRPGPRIRPGDLHRWAELRGTALLQRPALPGRRHCGGGQHDLEVRAAAFLAPRRAPTPPPRRVLSGRLVHKSMMLAETPKRGGGT